MIENINANNKEKDKIIKEFNKKIEEIKAEKNYLNKNTNNKEDIDKYQEEIKNLNDNKKIL